jgi:hypothetical protein
MLFGYIFAVISSSALQDKGGQVPDRSAESYRATAPFPGLMCGLPYQAYGSIVYRFSRPSGG